MNVIVPRETSATWLRTYVRDDTGETPWRDLTVMMTPRAIMKTARVISAKSASVGLVLTLWTSSLSMEDGVVCMI